MSIRSISSAGSGPVTGTAVAYPTLANSPPGTAVLYSSPPPSPSPSPPTSPPGTAVLYPSPPPSPSSSSTTAPAGTAVLYSPLPTPPSTPKATSTPMSMWTDLGSSDLTYKVLTLSALSLSATLGTVAYAPYPSATLPAYSPPPSTSTPVSNIDAQALALYGRYMTQDAVGVIWQTALISAYGLIFAVAVYSIFRKGLKSRSSIVMFCVIVSLYANSLALWAINTTVWLQNEHSVLMNHPNIPLPDRTGLVNNNIARFNIPAETLYLFNMVVADTVVIWRAWVLYPRTLWVMCIPCVMLLISSIFGIIEVTCLIGARYDYQASFPDSGRVCSHANVSWAFSFVTNATCTLLIGYKAWQHRRSMKSLNIAKYPRRMSADKVLSILVESGFIYCLLWIITFVNIDRQRPTIYVWELFSRMGDQISGIYPTLIIVIVNLKQTFWEVQDTTGSVSALQFAEHGQGESDVHVESREGMRSSIRFKALPVAGDV